MSILLALDIGTSKLCAMMWDTQTQRPLKVVSAPNDCAVEGLPDGWHEQNPLAIRNKCIELLQALTRGPELRGQPVAGIGISGQMHGVLLADAELRPLTNLITWRDTRCADQVQAARAALGADAPARLGCQISAGYGGLSLAWLASQNSYPNGAKALSIADFVAASLCDRAASEPTHAASWGLYHLARQDWDEEAVHILSLPLEWLPGLHPSCRALGELTPTARQELDLPRGVQVCSPLGDNQASVIGLAGMDPATLVLTLGTGGQISRPMQRPEYRAGMETRPMPFEGYIQVGASLCGGWSYAYLARFFQSVARELTGQEVEEGTIYARMNAWTEQADSQGLAVDTRFSGTRLEADLRGSIQGISTGNLQPAALTRALAEGMVEELYQMAQSGGELEGIRRVLATGNAVRKNPSLPQIIARRFGLPCQVSSDTEEAAMGAARAAALGLGVI